MTPVEEFESTVTSAMVEQLEDMLRRDERSVATVEKYLRDVRGFACWLGRQELSRETVVGWREALVSGQTAPATVNAKLAAVNALLRAIGREDCRARFLKVQRRAFRDASRDLSREEYGRLVEAARCLGRERIALVMETICSTGIRVSELRHVTVEAVQAGQAIVRLKGKVRVVLMPEVLCVKLAAYARTRAIVRGSLFVTSKGEPLSRCQIWSEMKALCAAAGVPASKVFPHNLRHLFATEYYRASRDLVKLADVLGHSSIETTRIYLVSSGSAHRRLLDGMGLVLPEPPATEPDPEPPATEPPAAPDPSASEPPAAPMPPAPMPPAVPELAAPESVTTARTFVPWLMSVSEPMPISAPPASPEPIPIPAPTPTALRPSLDERSAASPQLWAIPLDPSQLQSGYGCRRDAATSVLAEASAFRIPLYGLCCLASDDPATAMHKEAPQSRRNERCEVDVGNYTECAFCVRLEVIPVDKGVTGTSQPPE